MTVHSVPPQFRQGLGGTTWRRDLATRTDGHDAPGMSAAITTLHLGEMGQSNVIDLPPNTGKVAPRPILPSGCPAMRS